MNSSDHKQAAQKQWNQTPCGEVAGNQDNLDYFLSVQHNRYNVYAPWMKDFFKFDAYKEKKILEIGFGQGMDLVQFSLGGAKCFGVDITEKHFEMAKNNFKFRGLEAEFHLEDASKLHFSDNMFDVVYSFGVLHHTPDTIRCFAEAYRVLKPGGEFIVAIYYRYSAFHLVTMLLLNGLVKGKLKKLGYDGLMATVEKGADGIHIKPLVKTYSVRELKIMLSDFSKVSINIKHLDKDHFSLFGKLIPSALIKLLESKLGWYVIAKAIK